MVGCFFYRSLEEAEAIIEIGKITLPTVVVHQLDRLHSGF
jgi:hypothetical protein